MSMLKNQKINYISVCGIDEAGRGALAGPLIAAAVIVSPADIGKIRKLNLTLRDSKLLSKNQRQKIMMQILKLNIQFKIEEISALRINHHGIQKANITAIKNLIRGTSAARYIVDGTFRIGDAHTKHKIIICVPHADSYVLPVVLSGIIAKETRDAIMNRLHQEYPVFKWNQNAGYGTREHIENIITSGITRYHRLIFVASALRHFQPDRLSQ
jgi:ribonuclease HII